MADAVTTDTFDGEVLQSDTPVLVDFWGEWCGPCHAIAPVLDQIAEERGDLKVVKLNIDEEPAIAQRYGVMSIPTLILFKDGEPQAAAVGAMPKSMLEERLGLASAAACGVACKAARRGRGGLAAAVSGFRVFFFRMGRRRHCARRRLVDQAEHAHAVHEDDGAAPPAAHGGEDRK